MSRPLNLQFQKLEGMTFTNDVNATDNIGLYNINTGKFYNGKLITTKGYNTTVFIEKGDYIVPLKYLEHWFYMNTNVNDEGDEFSNEK